MTAPPVDDGLTGLTGAAADLMTRLGEPAVGLLALLETVFPPIPSEVVLPLAGYLAERGRMSIAGVLGAALVGAVLGNVLLYAVGRWCGVERAAALIDRVPLLHGSDVEYASAWFARHGRKAVFFGRFVPIVRALVSLPAGAQRMPFGTFVLLTALGIGTWNSFLVMIGYVLGTQYHVVEQYLGYLDYVVYAALLVLIGLAVRRNLRERASASV